MVLMKDMSVLNLGLALVDIETPDIVVAKTGVKINPNANHAQVKAISDPSALQWSRDGSAVACAQDDKVISET